MIGFTSREILLSVLFSAIYGVVFSVIYQLLITLFHVLKSTPDLIINILKSSKILPAPDVKCLVKDQKVGGGFAFFSVILYFLGFLLLSYLSLDGQLRLYMLVISSASLYISNLTFCVFLKELALFLLNLIVLLLSTVLRLVILPAKRLISFIYNNKT